MRESVFDILLKCCEISRMILVYTSLLIYPSKLKIYQNLQCLDHPLFRTQSLIGKWNSRLDNKKNKAML